MNRHQFQFAARQFRAGKVSLEQFTDQLYSSNGPAPPPGDAKPVATLNVDTDRARRCLFPEVVYAQGKTLQQVTQAAEQLLSAQQNVLVTRLDDARGTSLTTRFDDGTFNSVARTFRVNRFEPEHRPSARVAVVTAGTADAFVAEEAIETLTWMHIAATTVFDVGVAGPHRVLEHVEMLRQSDVVIVVAGAEGALPSVVAGHLNCPVIAVPTSVGYGASLGGVAALLSMINSCVPNVAVVNIDAGFKAAYLAGLICWRQQRRSG